MPDKELAWQMDKAMQGPCVVCRHCGMEKVLSPCYYCQYVLEHGSETDRLDLELYGRANKAALSGNAFNKVSE